MHRQIGGKLHRQSEAIAYTFRPRVARLLHFRHGMFTRKEGTDSLLHERFQTSHFRARLARNAHQKERNGSAFAGVVPKVVFSSILDRFGAIRRRSEDCSEAVCSPEERFRVFWIILEPLGDAVRAVAKRFGYLRNASAHFGSFWSNLETLRGL